MTDRKPEKDWWETPKARRRYVCTRCDAQGVKLWRQYQTVASHVELLCVDCAEKDQNQKHQLDAENPADRSDQIGWFWGYTAVPAAGCRWWHDLPLRTNERLQEVHRPDTPEGSIPAGMSWPSDAKILIVDLLKQLTLTTAHFLTHDQSCKARERGLGESDCDCGVTPLTQENATLVKKARKRLGLE